MPSFLHLTYFDYAVAVIFLFFLIRGGWIGFMRQLAAFLALVGSYVIAARYTDLFIPITERFVENPKLCFLISFAVIFFVSAIAFSLMGKLLQQVMKITLLEWFDRLLGVLLGAVKALVVASLIYMFLASSLSATNELLRKSFVSPYLQLGAEALRALIHDPRLQKYFYQKEPAILTDTFPAIPVLSIKTEQQTAP